MRNKKKEGELKEDVPKKQRDAIRKKRNMPEPKKIPSAT